MVRTSCEKFSQGPPSNESKCNSVCQHYVSHQTVEGAGNTQPIAETVYEEVNAQRMMSRHDMLHNILEKSKFKLKKATSIHRKLMLKNMRRKLKQELRDKQNQ